MKKPVALAVLATALTSPAFATDGESANYLCAVIDSTGFTSAPCEISAWKAAVITTIDMESSEARDVCRKISDHMRKNGYVFGRAWTLQIKSPYSGGNSIAFCPLPQP